MTTRAQRRPAPRTPLLSAFSALIFFLLPFTFYLAASEGPTLIFRKLFRSSSPEWVEIKVKPSGAASIDLRQLDEDAEPQAFEVSPALAARLFQMAAELKHFSGIELNVKRRLANLGEKTFRYENGAQAGEVSFNYTTDQTAQEMLTIFEGLSRQQEHLQTLQHRMRFDRLGVNDALLRLEVDLNRKLIPEPHRLVPMLDQIAAETRVVEIARQRARTLSDRIKLATRPATSPAAKSLRRLDFAFLAPAEPSACPDPSGQASGSTGYQPVHFVPQSGARRAKEARKQPIPGDQPLAAPLPFPARSEPASPSRQQA